MQYYGRQDCRVTQGFYNAASERADSQLMTLKYIYIGLAKKCPYMVGTWRHFDL